MQGWVAFVESRIAGSELSADAAQGATSFLVADGSDFVASGGVIDVGRSGQTFAYDAAVLNADGVTATVTVSVGLPYSVTAGQRVDVWALGRPVEEFYAGVLVTGATGPARAVLPPSLVALFPIGTRSDGDLEKVLVDYIDDELTVTGLVGQRPQHNLSYASDDPITPGAVTSSAAANPEEWAQGLPADVIGPGTVAADLVVGGTLQAGPLVASSQGLGVVLPGKGAPITVTDGGARFGGTVDADQMRTSAGADLGGASRIPAGSTLKLDGQVGPPSVPPNPFMDYVITTVAFPNDQRPQRRRSLAIKSATEAYTTTVAASGPVRLLVLNPTTGAFIERLPFTGAPTPASFASLSYSRQAGQLLTLEQDDVTRVWYLRRWSYTAGSLTYVSQAAVTQLGTGTGYRPAVACRTALSHEYVTVARSRADGKVDLHQFTDGAFTSTIVTADAYGMGDLEADSVVGGVIILTGATNLVYPAGVPAPAAQVGAWAGLPVMPVVNMSFVGSPGDLLGWLVVANGDPSAAGVASLDTDTNNRTWYLSGSSDTLAQHSDPFRAIDQWVQACWYDSTTGHESAPSAPVHVTKIPGCRLTFTIGSPPPGVGIDSVRFYMGAGTTFPGNSAMYRQATSAPGSYTASIFDVAISGASPPVSGYPFGGTNAKIVDANGVTIIDASGYVAGAGGGLGVDDDVFLGSDYIEVTGRV